MRASFSKLGLGTAQFGFAYGISNTNGQTSAREVDDVLSLAKESDINTLDTARAYGSSEDILGLHDLDKFKVVTKFPPNVQNQDELLQSFATSCAKMGVSYVYGYLAHSADTLIKSPGLWSSMIELREKGLVKKIGFSLYDEFQLNTLLDSGILPDLIQVPFSYLDRRFMPHFQSLKQAGVEIHVRSAFLQGLLLMQPDTLSSFFNPVKHILRQLRNQFTEEQHKLGFLLNFVLNHPAVDKVIIGVNNARQLSDNLSALKIESGEIDYAEIMNLPVSIIQPNLWPQQ